MGRKNRPLFVFFSLTNAVTAPTLTEHLIIQHRDYRTITCMSCHRHQGKILRKMYFYCAAKNCLEDMSPFIIDRQNIWLEVSWEPRGCCWHQATVITLNQITYRVSIFLMEPAISSSLQVVCHRAPCSPYRKRLSLLQSLWILSEGRTPPPQNKKENRRSTFNLSNSELWQADWSFASTCFLLLRCWPQIGTGRTRSCFHTESLCDYRWRNRATEGNHLFTFHSVHA